MRVDSVDVFEMAHPMREAWETAYGSDASVHGVMVRMRSGGHVGWSESNPLELPTYSPEYASGVFLTVSSVMAPLLVGRTVESAEEVLEVLAPFKGNSFAKAALEMAWWQLESSMTGKPLYELLGGRERPIRVGEALGVSKDVGDLITRIGEAFERGYSRIKLKVRPDRDLDVIKTVVSEFPDGEFHIDCNCGYSLDDMAMFQELDELGLVMIEQPLGYGDLVNHATLQRSLDTPICLDESCSSVEAAKAAIELGSCQIINIKPPRVGGIANSIEILKLCRDHDLDAWVGSMLETSIGVSCNLALASLDGVTLPCDAFPSARFYEEEITSREFELVGPGLMSPFPFASDELIPEPRRLEKRALRHVTIE